MTVSHQRQEHIGTYYTATANEKTDYAPLHEDLSVDVCVVGGGFTGVATALSLTERGYSVALLEANRVGWGASGRNGGQLINGVGGLDRIRKDHGAIVDDLVWEMRWRGNEIIRERVERYGIQCDLKDGYAEVARKPRQLRDIEEAAGERHSRHWTHRYEIWDKHKTREKLGTDSFYGAFVCYRDGHLHPLNLCIGEALAAANQGARIFEHSPVTGIERGTRPVVRCQNGSVTANAVVLGGNAYGRLEPKHLSNLVFPVGSYIIATEPLTPELAGSINADDVAVCDLNEVVDYYRLSADKRLLYGGACNYSGRDPASIEAYIRPRMRKVYPQLEDVRIDFEWGGKIGIVLNRIPAVGRIDGDIYYAQGYSGHGLAPTHLMGEILADAVTGTMERFDLFANIKHFRLPGSQWLGNQIIALGMLYYKLMDRL